MITLENVSKAFGTNHVLRGVDLTVERGTSMVIIGGSGTGKSVLLKTIIGLLPWLCPSAGLDLRALRSFFPFAVTLIRRIRFPLSWPELNCCSKRAGTLRLFLS